MLDAYTTIPVGEGDSNSSCSSSSWYKLESISALAICVLMNGMYPVAKRATKELAKIAVIAFCSPARYAKIKVVAIDVLVIATVIAEAMHRQQSCTGMNGKK